MKSFVRWTGLVVLSAALPVISAAIAFGASFVLIVTMAGDGQDWSGANQSAVGLLALPVGGLFGIAGFAVGAIYGYRILSRALLAVFRPKSSAEFC